MSNNKINALLDGEHIKILFSIFKSKNIELRLVGGSIRDWLSTDDAIWCRKMK